VEARGGGLAPVPGDRGLGCVGGGGGGLCSPAIECQGGCGLVGRRVVTSAAGG
jgi:hypothetical protein